MILFTADGKKGSVQANAIQSGVAERVRSELLSPR